MAHEAHQPTISSADLFQAAEAAARSGRRQTVQLHGQTLAIVPQETAKGSARQTSRHRNAFLAAYGSITPLATPLSDSQMTEVAAAEAAQDAARAGLPPYARS